MVGAEVRCRTPEASCEPCRTTASHPSHATSTASSPAIRSAAALWDLEGFTDDVVEITVPGSNRARLEGVIVHESTVFGPLHLGIVDRIPVASAARTLCDLTAVARPWMIDRAVDEALRRSIVDLRTLTRVAHDLEGRGRLRCT